jgi:lysophospholipid acyltransferase (LPLAT)-like uncharacterized protein
VPVGFGAAPAKALGSWDRFVVPLPFSRGVFVYGEPIEVAPSAGEAEMEEARQRLERALGECASEAASSAADARRFAGLERLRSLR